VARVLLSQATWYHTREHTQKSSHLAVSNVGKTFLREKALKSTREYTQERRLIAVINVARDTLIQVV
jgi:hypothetical protein